MFQKMGYITQYRVVKRSIGSNICKINSDSDHCIVLMIDTGIGINTGDMEKIFNRFFQIKSLNIEMMVGSGIGLSFSIKLAALHCGSITVKSTPDKG